MKVAQVFFYASLFSAATALAQQSNPFNGTWGVEFDSKKGAAREGTVVINDQGGTWEVLNHKKNNACAGRAAPIAIQRATDEELVFEISMSKALTGCKDKIATLKRADDKTLQGELDDGRQFKLVRQ
jgi:hypothetical protein